MSGNAERIEMIDFAWMVKRKMLNGIIIDGLPLMITIILLLAHPFYNNVWLELSHYLFIGVSSIIFLTGWYSKPIKEFAIQYNGVEPSSYESECFMNKIGNDLVKYPKLFASRDLPIEYFKR